MIDPPPRPSGRRWPPSPWVAASGVVALAVLAPFGAVVAAALRGSPELWSHLLAYVLPAAVVDTLILLAGVGLVVVTLGAGLAWLVTAYDFRGRGLVDGAALLPLAVPTYIIAFAYLDLLHPVGPVQEALRALLGYDNPREFRLPDVRSMAGCIFLLGVVLYPYVYLPTRALFMMQAANLFDTARTLGTTRREVFFRVALPLARPAVAVGLSLALMETLNDIGAAEFLGVRTLTVSIYTTWVTRSDLAGAAQIALAMLSVVILLVSLERWARRAQRFANDAQHPRPLKPHRLTGVAGAAAFTAAALPIVAGFVVPMIYLVHAALTRIGRVGVPPAIWAETVTTVLLSAGATVLTILAGLVVAFAARDVSRRVAAGMSGLASLGYATPGTVVAIGVLPVATTIDGIADWAALWAIGVSTGLATLGSGAALIYAYTVRFLAITVGGAEAALSKVSRSLDEAAATLGTSRSRRLWHIHLPLIRPAVAMAALLVFVDCMKELPVTLLLRPIGVETLATHLYGEAARGTYEDAAVAALVIVLVGLGPVVLLARLGRRNLLG